tara:strand:- start:751 stop:1590 length:840 start_codon:yes stop_codon:yes gene_type:complete
MGKTSNITSKNDKALDSSNQEIYNKLATEKYKSEAGHWYTKEGEPMYTIIGANGRERPTTLRDAKSLGLVPSVTTIIGMVAKPSLENWKINQAINSALTLKKEENESLLEFAYRCKRDSKEIGRQAAEKGTEIHASIEKGFLGLGTSHPYKIIKSWLDETFPNEEWIAEDSFCAKQGYGGKIDLYSKSGIFIDFKTKDNLEGKEPSKLVYDDHGMQLSAYAQGCNIKKPERVSIFVDRQDTNIILFHVWDKESHTKHKEMFNSILKFWQLVKNYEWKKS